MQNQEKAFRLLTIICVVVGFACFIIALITKRMNLEYKIWIYIGVPSLLIPAFINATMRKNPNPQTNQNEIPWSKRLEELQKAKKKKEIPIFYFNCETSSLEGAFQTVLESYHCENYKNGKIFYKQSQNFHNEKFPSYDVFYLLNEDIKNSFDYAVESKNIQEYAIDVDNFLKQKTNKKIDFVNCVIVFQHNNLTQDQKDFYYVFPGLWIYKMRFKFIKNKKYTYCGFDKSDRNLYFPFSFSSQSAQGVDLSYLISMDLNLEVIE